MVYISKKIRCTKCKRNLCQKHFRNKDIHICEFCKKKIPTNPFYNPNQIHKFGLSGTEKMELYKEHKRNGLSDSESWRRINYLNYYLRTRRLMYNKYKEKESSSEFNKTDNNKFLIGLGQLK